MVGIISYNRAMVLPRAIQSALDQVDVNLSVFVLDNHSTDHTRKLAEDFPQVCWIFSEVNLGVSKGRNELMSRPGFDYFVSLDDDSWFMEKNSISKAIEVFEQNNKIAALAFEILTADRPTSDDSRAPFPVRDFIGCGHMIKLDLVRPLGFYQSMPGFYGGEEKELCIQLIDAGFLIAKTPDIKVWHDKTGLTRDIQSQNRSGICNDLVSFYRQTPWLFVMPLLLYKIFSHIRFSYKYEGESVTRSTRQGIIDFFKICITGRLPRRRPVSFRTLRKVRILPHA